MYGRECVCVCVSVSVGVCASVCARLESGLTGLRRGSGGSIREGRSKIGAGLGRAHGRSFFNVSPTPLLVR